MQPAGNCKTSWQHRGTEKRGISGFFTFYQEFTGCKVEAPLLSQQVYLSA
jgi:hypothetical protein